MSQFAPQSLTIPTSYGQSLLTLMRERGHQEADVLAGTQLTAVQLQAPRGQIEGWQYAVALGNALRLDGDAGLAYELGLRSQVTKHGFVGFGLISCGTLREAIEFSERYFKTRVSTFTSEVSVVGDQAIISLRETVPMGAQRSLVMDMVLVELCSLFARVLGLEPGVSGWTSEIWVTYPEPAAYARFKDKLPRFRFNQAAEQIRIPARMLDEPIATADTVSMQLAIDRCEQDIASQIAKQVVDQTTTSEVTARMQCRDGRYPDIAAMAQALLLSERTLKRRLQDEGTGFQTLLDKARYQDSMRLLANRSLAIKQVAQAVGYEDPANFARAFSKWSGSSPRAWRQQQDADGPI